MKPCWKPCWKPLVLTVAFWLRFVAARPNDSSNPSGSSDFEPEAFTLPEEKYFHEPGRDDILGHYDTRFFKDIVTYEERTETLVAGIRAYLTFFQERNLDTWIAHGTLLGWWWNGKMLPWDWDVDTQVSTKTLTYIAGHLNHTRYEYVSDDKTVKREFLLDVNPYSRQRERGDGLNIIDARWIDTRNGLYIDITGVSELNPDTEPGVLSCKNFHKYNFTDLYPMRKSMYEGVPARIPYRYQELLIEEYGKNALIAEDFKYHNWSQELKEWIPDQPRIDEVARIEEEERKKKEEEEKMKEEGEESQKGQART